MFSRIKACLLFSFGLAVVLHSGECVDAGDSYAQVIEELGEPTGAVDIDGRQILTYNGANIKLRDGKVVHIDRGFDAKQKTGEAAAEAAQAQRDQGLIQHEGVWMTRAQVKKDEKAEIGVWKDKHGKARSKAKSDSGRGDFVDIRDGGRQVELKNVLASGKVTIVDFHADWCGPCKKLSPSLFALIKNDSDVALRKIDIVKWGTPVAEQFKINSIPSVWVFDGNGKLVGEPTSSLADIKRNIARAK